MIPFQIDKPVFVRDRHRGITFKGKHFKYNAHFPWKEMNLDQESAVILYNSDRIYHNPDLEEQYGIISPNLLTPTNLSKLITLVNGEVNRITTTKDQYTKKKIKGSAIRDKQLGLINTWVNANSRWTEVIDYYNKTLHELYNSQGKDKEATEEETN